MPGSIDVAVIGGGAAGIFAALSAAQKGSVALIDPRGVGMGALSRSAGIVTMQLDSERDVRLVLRSMELIKSVAKRSIKETGFLQLGNEYLLEDSISALRGVGVPYRLLGGDEVMERWPLLSVEEDLLGIYTERDLSLEPQLFVEECKHSLEKQGVELHEGIRAERIVLEGPSVRHIELSDGSILRAERYIVSAGAWTRGLLAGSGIHLPMKIITCTSFRFELGVKALVPSFSDEVLHSYWRPWGSELIGGGYDAWISDEPDMNDAPPPEEYAKRAEILLSRRIRTAKRITLLAGWRGPCSVPPDLEPVLGFIGDESNCVVVDGLRGYGLMRGPAIGELASQLVLAERTWLDISPYSPARLKEYNYASR